MTPRFSSCRTCTRKRHANRSNQPPTMISISVSYDGRWWYCLAWWNAWSRLKYDIACSKSVGWDSTKWKTSRAIHFWKQIAALRTYCHSTCSCMSPTWWRLRAQAVNASQNKTITHQWYIFHVYTLRTVNQCRMTCLQALLRQYDANCHPPLWEILRYTEKWQKIPMN